MDKMLLTVGCKIPGAFGEYVDFYSNKSLLDADIVLFYPALPHFFINQRLGPSQYSQIEEAIKHWSVQIEEAVEAGITVFFMLNTMESVFTQNGSSTTNYDVLGHSHLRHYMSFVEGDSMVIPPNEQLLRDYWKEFGEESQYHVQMAKLRELTPLITTRQGNRVVGAIQRRKNSGALVLLPWLAMYRKEFFTEIIYRSASTVHEYTWNVEGEKWGRRFFQALISLDSAIKGVSKRTPVPRWVQSEAYVTTQEKLLSQKLTDIETGIAKLGKKKEETQAKLDDAGTLKALLYEKGHPLNDVVLEAMRLMGFQAENFRESDSEYDAVLECPEGRCIGEVVGRDNGAIDNKKMAQLETNIHEDFSRDDVSEPAKAVLFGNGHRLQPPEKRPAEQFTSKCVKMAERNRAALIKTCDLFEVAKALLDNPDTTFAAECRKAILQTEGKVVVFPKPPKPIDVVTDHSSLHTMAFAHPQ